MSGVQVHVGVYEWRTHKGLWDLAYSTVGFISSFVEHMNGYLLGSPTTHTLSPCMIRPLGLNVGHLTSLLEVNGHVEEFILTNLE